MTHRLVRTFRRAFLPALFLLLPTAGAFAFATSQAPAAFPTTAPVRKMDPPPAQDDESAQNEQSKTLAPAAGSGPVKISVAPPPFLSVGSGDQIVREFVVQNDSANPVDVTFVLNYRIGWRNYFRRSVTTSRKVPAHSIQTIPVFLPTYMVSNPESIEVSNPQIYVNGRPFKPLPPGIFNAGELSWHFFTAPSSFSTCEPVANAMVRELTKSLYSPYRSYGEFEIGISDSDTVQWPSIPQFYQVQHLLLQIQLLKR